MGRLPVPSIISVEYMSILLSPVIEIDVSECVYWDCASIVRSMSKFGGVNDILALYLYVSRKLVLLFRVLIAWITCNIFKRTSLADLRGCGP